MNKSNITKNCAICNKEFKVIPSTFKRRKTCSKKCWYIYLSKYHRGWHHIEESKHKISICKLGKKLSKKHRESLSKSQRGKFGKYHNRWKGGKIFIDGYIHLYMPKHPLARNKLYIPEHRYFMEQKIGRFLTSDEVVHHINGIRDDNRLENLVLLTRSEHPKLHKRK